jgi:AraC-like DNA-binding protein
VIDAETIGASKRMQTVMAETMVPYSVEPQLVDRVGRSPCIVRRAQLDGLSLLDCDVPDLFSGRTRALESAGSGLWVITLTTAGQQVVEQDNRQAILEPGDIFIVDAALPGTCRIPTRIHTCTLVVPKPLVSMRGPLPDKVPASSPIARLLGDYLSLLVRELATLPAAAAKATLELVQLVATTDSPPLDPAPLRIALLPQVRRYIERQLHNPELTPSSIADANAISVRTLHAMFAATGESVSAYIRRQRLERSHEALISRPDVAVIDISRRWGFKNASHFARAFKAEYGMAPKDLRRMLVEVDADGVHVPPTRTTSAAVQ